MQTKTNKSVMFEGENYTLINECGYYMEAKLKWMTEDDKKRFIEEANQDGSKLDDLINEMIQTEPVPTLRIPSLFDRMRYATMGFIPELDSLTGDIKDGLNYPKEIMANYDYRLILSVLDEMSEMCEMSESDVTLYNRLNNYLFNCYAKWHREQLTNNIETDTVEVRGTIHQSIEFLNEVLTNENAEDKCLEVAEKYYDEGYNEMIVLPMNLIERVNLNDEWLVVHKYEHTFDLSSFNTNKGGENDVKS